MFTGIIEKQAKILEIKKGLFVIENSFGFDLKIGQSIAHDGACMTIEKFDDEKYSFFTMQESLDKTNFGNKKAGDFFNIERCLKIGGRLDGHFVSGHIDTVGKIQNIKINSDSSKLISIEFPSRFKQLIIEKGSITVNGISLTVVEITGNTFSISIIPLTQKITNIGKLKVGDLVNLEFDMIGKYINAKF